MTVLVTIPQSTYSDAEAKRIFDEIVGDFGGSAATNVSAFKDDNYKTDDGGSGFVNMAEFDLPADTDMAEYDSKKSSYEAKYENIAITIESSDSYPVREEVDINVNP